MKKVILKRPDPNNPHIKAYTVAVQKSFKALHIVSSQDGWVVKKVRSSGVFRVFEKKDDAVKYGTKIAKGQRTDLIIHGKDGRIKERNSYGYDSYPPRG